jgi:aspartyl-tRNA(Asn)/glutamyl-tRNA(Gln) amidotransferase subunit B
VRKPGAPLGTRCEIKNLNSIRLIGQAIDHEARRQIEILEDGGAIEQETRLFDPNKGETRSMRNKEEAHDYRYFPDPDLLPLELTAAFVEELRTHLPELPDEKKARFTREYGLSGYDAGVLVAEQGGGLLRSGRKGLRCRRCQWVINELTGRLNKEGKDIAASPVSAPQLGAILTDRVGTISARSPRICSRSLARGGDPRHRAGARHATAERPSAIEPSSRSSLQNPDKAGKLSESALIGWLSVGDEGLGSKANPKTVNELL